MGERKLGAAAAVGIVVGLMLMHPPAAARLASQSVGGQLGDTVSAATALGALNAQVTLAISGQQSAALSCASGTATLVLTPSLSFDGGTNFPVDTFFDNANSGGFDPTLNIVGSTTALGRGIVLDHGVTNVRVKVTGYTSGSVTCTLRGVAVNSTVITEGVPSQMYTAIVKGIAAGAAKDYINLWNAGNSGKVLRIRGVYAAPDTTAAVTGVSVMGILSQSGTAGTTCTAGTINGHDSLNTFPSGLVTVVSNCTTDPVITFDWGAAAVATDETPPGGGFGRQVLYEWMPTMGGQPWTLRENQGLMFKSVATLVPAGTITIWIVFTM
jgi:hypothetical protein